MIFLSESKGVACDDRDEKLVGNEQISFSGRLFLAALVKARQYNMTAGCGTTVVINRGVWTSRCYASE